MTSFLSISRYVKSKTFWILTNMKLLAYVRVSTKKQKKAKTHLTQEKEIKKWAEREGHEIIEWYRDLAVSGADVKERFEYQRMLRDIIKKGDGIVAFRLSRTARSLNDLLNFVTLITDLKKHIFYVVDRIDTSTPLGRFNLQILGAVVELQREVIVENAELGRQRVREEGGKLGGPVEINISMERVEAELRKGLSPEQMAPKFKVSGRTIRRRMKYWNIYEDYDLGRYRRGEL